MSTIRPPLLQYSSVYQIKQTGYPINNNDVYNNTIHATSKLYKSNQKQHDIFKDDNTTKMNKYKNLFCKQKLISVIMVYKESRIIDYFPKCKCFIGPVRNSCGSI